MVHFTNSFASCRSVPYWLGEVERVVAEPGQDGEEDCRILHGLAAVTDVENYVMDIFAEVGKLKSKSGDGKQELDAET